MIRTGKYLVLTALCTVIVISIYITISKGEKTKYSDDPKYFNATLFDHDPLMEKRLILVNGRITESVASRVIKQLLVLEYLHPGEPISLLINTPGGQRSQWQSIVQTMDFLASPVNVIGIGSVSSSGVYILANATGKRIVHESAVVGIHMLFKKDSGNFSAGRVQDENIRNYWSDLKLPKSFFPLEGEKFNETFYLNADQALEYGLVDKIYRRGSEPMPVLNNFTQ